MVKNLLCVSCGSLKGFPHTFSIGTHCFKFPTQALEYLQGGSFHNKSAKLVARLSFDFFHAEMIFSSHV